MEREVSANPCACRKNTKKGKINGDLSPSLSSSIEEAKLDPGFCKGLPPILRSCMACAGTSWPRGDAAQGTGLSLRPSQRESNYWGGAGWSRCLCCQITNLGHGAVTGPGRTTGKEHLWSTQESQQTSDISALSLAIGADVQTY